MKKILTITCHNVYNHGATLQQLAMLEYLKSLNFDAKTINYKPSYLSNHYNLWAISNNKFQKNIFLQLIYLTLKLPVRLIERKRKTNFDAFEKKYLDILPKKFHNNLELKSNLPEADFYITGSDQIWNSFFENGKDPAFYLDFVPTNKIKIAYAASFAIDEFGENINDFVFDKVSRINNVSVRETSGLTILEKLGITNAIQVLDPVFLLDADFWKNNFVQTINQNFIFVYDFDNNLEIKKTALYLAKKHNLKIYSVNQNINYTDKKYVFSAPNDFLSLIFNAKFVLSNSFHAVAFSLIFNKKFLVFNRSEKINTRMRDLLENLNISHLLINENQKTDIETNNFDYKTINILISNKIKISKDFLLNALK